MMLGHFVTKSARRTAAAAAPRMASAGSARYLSVHEYLAVQILNKFGVPTPKSEAAKSTEEADKVAKSFGTDKLVIKAQVLAGGRGKGHFKGGLQGGVQLVDSADKIAPLAKQMLGDKLVTKQTGEAGRVCNAIMVAEQRKPTHEYYAAILNDRSSDGPALVASREGGTSIEEVAAKTPEAIITTPIDYFKGLDKEKAVAIAKELQFKPENVDAAADIFQKLFHVFKENDATLIEINPLAEVEGGGVLAMDAKLNFDDNAEFRHPDLFELRDITQEDPTEVEAHKYDLNFIKLDGDIGCLVNGAGLAMATMDTLSLNGGSPANFLDVGGAATKETITKAFGLLQSDPKVKSIFVNIFGGIMRCDIVAEGIVAATKELALEIPLVVRLQGTKEVEAKEIIANSGLKIYAHDGLDEGAKDAVAKAAAA